MIWEGRNCFEFSVTRLDRGNMVGLGRLELPTSPTPKERATKLRHSPTKTRITKKSRAESIQERENLQILPYLENCSP